MTSFHRFIVVCLTSSCKYKNVFHGFQENKKINENNTDIRTFDCRFCLFPWCFIGFCRARYECKRKTNIFRILLKYICVIRCDVDLPVGNQSNLQNILLYLFDGVEIYHDFRNFSAYKMIFSNFLKMIVRAVYNQTPLTYSNLLLYYTSGDDGHD